jgi:hypothetical protein
VNEGRLRRMLTGTFGLLMLAGLVGWFATACGGSGGSTSAPAATGSFAGGTPAPHVGDASGSGAVGGTRGSGSNVLQIGPDIVKVASISLQVRKGSFSDRFQQAAAVAAANGGFVESSDTSAGDVPSGTITIRVPVDRFETVLGQLKGLGTLKGTKISGEDVTSKFVDLEAQLRNWRSQESVLLRLMSKATTIDESIRVQQQLQRVQGTIEELAGQDRMLGNQVVMSTITVSLTEASPAPPPPGKRGPLLRAWDEALRGFVNVIAAVVVGVGYLLPVGLIVLVGWLGWLGVRRVQRRRPEPVPTA